MSVVKPLDQSEIKITTKPLHQPPLDELIAGKYFGLGDKTTVRSNILILLYNVVLLGGLTKNFAEATVEIADCPVLKDSPFTFYGEGSKTEKRNSSKLNLCFIFI